MLITDMAVVKKFERNIKILWTFQGFSTTELETEEPQKETTINGQFIHNTNTE